MYSPSFLRQHFPKLLPSLRQRTDPLVVATVDGQTVNCFAHGGNSPPGSPRAARPPRALRRPEYICQSLTLSTRRETPEGVKAAVVHLPSISPLEAPSTGEEMTQGRFRSNEAVQWFDPGN